MTVDDYCNKSLDITIKIVAQPIKRFKQQKIWRGAKESTLSKFLQITTYHVYL